MRLKGNIIKCAKILNPLEDILGDINQHIPKNEYLHHPYYSIFEYPQNELKEELTWKLMIPKEKDLFTKIVQRADYKLGDICEIIQVGIQGTPDKIFLGRVVQRLSNDLVKFEPLKYAKESKCFEIEKDLLKEFIKGENIRKWKIKWPGLYIIYPQKKEKERVVAISRIEMKKRYPKTWKYLQEHEKELKKRHYLLDAIDKGQRQEWYELWCPRDPEWLGKTKIVNPDISNKSNFALDDIGYYIHNTAYGIKFKSLSNEDRYYLLGLLNSETLEFHFKHISQLYSGKYYRYITQFLKELPIILPKISKERKLAAEIIQKVKTILQQVNLSRLADDLPTYLNEYRSRGVEFDESKYIFGANHSKLKPFLSGLPGKGYVVYPSQDEDSIWVDTKEKAQYLILALRNRKVKQNETVKILIPRDNSVVTEILERVKKTAQEIKATPIDQLEEEINELVYQLYGLNENDKSVIEDFLKKF